jgi:bifunctional non-homologous end joining protein LigD
VIRFGVSGLPPDGDDAAFLDGQVALGRRAYELAFVKDFPWKERRCREFGELAAERDVRLSIHAPYFAILTVAEEEKAAQCLAALEHTMKLAAALRAPIICAHFGHTHGEESAVLMDRIRERLDRIAPKVAHLGVGLGLEVGGNDRSFGTLGDIAVLCEEFAFIRPIVDWAHLHAMTGGALISRQAFASVLGFVRDSFPAWMIDPLQTQFTDNLFGPHGEVKHLPYGEGTLAIEPLAEAAAEAGMPMVVISEAREETSHAAIQAGLEATLARSAGPAGRPVATALAGLPDPVRAVGEGSGFRVLGTARPLRLSNLDKPMFPDGVTKGDLVQYYASVASVLLPHLAGRPLSMSRYPDGIDGPTFYEKRAPGHQPDWMATVPVPSDSMGGIIDFLIADSREALMWFANMGCIEVHPFHARAESLDRPDWAVFDLDPADGASWEQVVDAALLLRQALDRLRLRSYPKLSGSRGLHVYLPLDPVHPFERIRRFVDAVGKLLAAADPDTVTMAWEKPKRAGRVFVDANRNASGQTIASVYSVRPRPGAPVSAPLRWEEVGSVANGDVTVRDVWERLRHLGDLFAPVVAGGQRLDAAEEALGL